MRNKVLLALALFLGCAAAATAVDIPDGVESNCSQGKFGKNKYVTLKTAVVEQWLSGAEDGEVPVVGVELDFKQPAKADKPEKISIAFMVVDTKFDKQFSPVLGGAVRESGPVLLNWDLRDKAGKKIEDGIYNVVMNITGEYHGDLLRDGVFPLYVASGAPEVGDRTLSSDEAVLEYGGAPAIGFTTKGIGVVTVADHDADGNEVSHWENVMRPGKHTLRSDLLDKDDTPLPPGKYTTTVVARNKLGESDTLEYEYELAAPPALELSVKLDGGAAVKVEDETTVPFTVALNQNAMLTVQHVAEDGSTDYIGESVEGKPAALYDKGSHQIVWHRVDTDEFTRYTTGKHRFRVTAATLSGEKKTVESPWLTLTPAPKPPAPKKPAPSGAKQEPVRTIPNVTLTLEPDHLLIGGRMVTTVKYRFDQDSMIKVTVYDKGGKVVKRLVDSQNEHIKKGSYSKPFDAEDFDYGNYKIVFEATNFYGTRTATKYLSVTWR